MRFLDHWIDRTIVTLNKIGGFIILPAMTAMMTTDVILRYAFNAPLSWGLEASQYMLLLVFIFGMADGFRSGAHIRMDLIYRLLPSKLKRLMTLIYAGCAIAIFALLMHKGSEEALFLKSINEVTQYLHLPKYLFAGLIVAVSAIIILFFAVRSWAVITTQRLEVESDHDDQNLMGIE